jgi:hypothetical protein
MLHLSKPFAPAVTTVLMVLAASAWGQFGGGGANLTYFSTSLAIVGDTSTAPLDQNSLNGLFTAAFRNDMEKKLREKLGENVAYPLMPREVQLIGLNSNNKNSRALVAMLQVGYENPPEEIFDELQIEAPKVALEQLRERVDNYIHMQQDLDESRLHKQQQVLQQQRENLERKLADYQAMLLELKSEAIEPSKALREHYLELRERQRADRLTLLEIEARREAVVAQVEELQRRASDDGAEKDHALLAAMKQAVEQRRQRAETIKQESKEASELALVAKLVEEKRKAITYGKLEQREGHRPISEVSNLQSALHEAELQQAVLEKQLEERVKQAEAEAIEGRIAYLKQLEEYHQAEFGSRLEKLNEMLTDVAVRSGEIEARREAIEREIAATEAVIAERMKADLKLERLEREVQQLESYLRHVEQQLFQIEMQMQQPAKQEIVILPWGG